MMRRERYDERTDERQRAALQLLCAVIPRR
jgi:hypothetical protein